MATYSIVAICMDFAICITFGRFGYPKIWTWDINHTGHTS